jgi:hypothetical protein
MNSLPKTLDETYDRIIQYIDDDYHGDALTVLQWLAFSFRPIQLEEVVEALAIDRTRRIFNPERRLPEPRDILSICSSLVIVMNMMYGDELIEGEIDNTDN